MAPWVFLKPDLKGKATHSGPLTEATQALVVDGTATGIHGLYRHLLELPELSKKMATVILPDPLLVLKPRMRRSLPASHGWPSGNSGKIAFFILHTGHQKPQILLSKAQCLGS